MLILKIFGAVFLIVLLYILFLTVCGLFVNPKREYEKHSNFYRSLLNGATAIGMKVMRIRLVTTGIEKIPSDTKNLLFVSNHRSKFDPIITWHILKKWKPAFISKAENFKTPIFGRIIRRCCFMAIDRDNPKRAIRTIHKAAELLKNGEVSVGIYPEGTRSKNCELLPFHNGVFMIAKKADADIVVLSVSGTEMVHKNYPFHRTTICFDVLEVIPSQTVKDINTESLGAHIRSLMEEHL